MGIHETLILPQAPPADRLPPDLRDTTTEYRIDLPDGRVFLLRLERGGMSLDEREGEADCRLRCSMEMLHRLLAGENLLTALARGDIHVSGDLESAKRLYQYLRISRGTGGHP